MLEFAGWVGSSLLAFCAVPQAVQSYKQKHSHGISKTFLVMWLVGEILTAAYVLPKKDWPLLVNYGVNIICLVIITRYKFYPLDKQSFRA